MTDKTPAVGEVILKDVRLSFAQIFRAKAFNDDDDGGTPKFNCSFLIDKVKGKPAIDTVKAAIREVARAKWGDDIPKLKPDKFCLRDGDNEEWDGYAGCMYVSASNARRPTIVDRDRRALSEDDGRAYSGCYVNAVIRVWAQDNKWGKRINASLEAIQFVRHGEAFGARPVDAEEAFDDLGDDEAAPIAKSTPRNEPSSVSDLL